MVSMTVCVVKRIESGRIYTIGDNSLDNCRQNAGVMKILKLLRSWLQINLEVNVVVVQAMSLRNKSVGRKDQTTTGKDASNAA